MDYIYHLLFGYSVEDRIQLLNDKVDDLIVELEAELNDIPDDPIEEDIPSQHTLRYRHLVLQDIKQQSFKLKARKSEIHPLAIKNRFRFKRNKKYR